MHRDATGREQSEALAQDRGQRLARRLVEKNAGADQIEVAVREVRPGRIGLREVHTLAERLCAPVRVAQQRRADVDRMHFGVGERIDERQRAVAHRAAHVEDAPRFEIRVMIADELRGRAADVVVHRPHHAERIDVDAAVVQRAGRHVAMPRITCIAAGHAVDVHAGHVFRQGQRRIQRQRAERRRALLRCARLPGRGCLLHECRQLALDGIQHGVPQQFLADTLHRRIRAEHRVLHHQVADLVAILRRASLASLERGLHFVVIDRMHARHDSALDVRLEAAYEILPGGLVTIRCDEQRVACLRHGEEGIGFGSHGSGFSIQLQSGLVRNRPR